MGKISFITKEQKIILSEVNKDSFFKDFYFTGGTALATYYLKHRYSEDLDFFTENKFDARALEAIVEGWKKKFKFEYTSEFIEVVEIFMIKFKGKAPLKVDFAYYPYRTIKDAINIDGIKVNSLVDIAVNKLHTITQRAEVKDFVDLYFLLQKFSLWDIIEGVRIKFKQKLEPFIYASDFLKVEEFDTLPKMIKPLTLNELRLFFREKAKELGKKSIA